MGFSLLVECEVLLLSKGYCFERPAPMDQSYRLGIVTWGYQVRIPVGTDICHCGCAYTVLQIVKRHGVYSAAYGTVHYKEPLKSFEIRVGHSPGFRFPSVAMGGGPRVVVSTAAFHARVRGSVPGLGGLKETKLFLPHPRVKVSIVGSLRDREIACSASDRQGSNFESCVWRTVSSQSSHHPQEVLLAQFSLYVHKGGLKPDSFHFISVAILP